MSIFNFQVESHVNQSFSPHVFLTHFHFLFSSSIQQETINNLNRCCQYIHFIIFLNNFFLFSEKQLPQRKSPIFHWNLFFEPTSQASSRLRKNEVFHTCMENRIKRMPLQKNDQSVCCYRELKKEKQAGKGEKVIKSVKWELVVACDSFLFVTSMAPNIV